MAALLTFRCRLCNTK